jgi:hypothetical protein
MVAPAFAGKAVRCDGEDIIKVHLCAWNRAFRVCVCVCVCVRERESLNIVIPRLMSDPANEFFG